jgi:ATP-dependent Lon protease
MSEEEFHIEAPKIFIPEAFKSESTGDYLRNCLICDKELIESGEPYMIEKAVRQYHKHEVKDVIFEHAICMKCQQDMSDTMSKESVNKINQYFTGHMNIYERQLLMFNNDEIDYEKWLTDCIIKHKPVDTFSEYQIYAHCEGEEMVMSIFPFIIGDEALEEMQNLLSKQTKDELDRFMDEYHTGPSEFKDLLTPRPIFI